MARTYTLGKRADRQAQTRLRIVEAAVDLHTRIGPARTTFSMVAAEAGVQRHTLHAHFPDERSLLLACSALHLERQPLPDAEPWRAIGDRTERLRTGFSELYLWYERNAALAGCVLRDAEHHDPTREIVGLRIGPFMTAYAKILGEGLGREGRALLGVALGFHTWRSLAYEGGLDRASAVAVMVRAVNAAG